MVLKVIKRNGTEEKFNFSKLKRAVSAAFVSSGVKVSNGIFKTIKEKLEELDDEVDYKVINDIVEDALMESGFNEVARCYISYRSKQQRIRVFTDSKKSFIERYKKSGNTADATIDDNSNVSNHNIAVMNSEIHKSENMDINMRMWMDKIEELYPTFNTKQFMEDINTILYPHDSSSQVGMPYCLAVTMYPFLLNGIEGLGGLSAAPKNIDSFCGMYCNLLFALASQVKGAVATPGLFLSLDWFARKTFGDEYYKELDTFYIVGSKLRKLMGQTGRWFRNVNELKDFEFENMMSRNILLEMRDSIVNDSNRPLTDSEMEEFKKNISDGNYADVRVGDGTRTIIGQIDQFFQQITYTINQPAGARGGQSVFCNFSIFDKPFFDGMYGEFVYPDGTKPNWESFNWLQKHYLHWLNQERLKCILTFPVISVAMIYKDGKFEDQEMFEYVCQEYAEGNSFFTYISDSADSLSSCCRLSNKLSNNTFSTTNGQIGEQTGSKNVITINLSRTMQDFVSEIDPNYRKTDNSKFDIFAHQEEYQEYMKDILSRIYKYQIAYNEVIKDFKDAGMLSAYSAGFIDMKRQFLTIGINGLNQAAEFVGIKCNKNDDYKKLCNLIYTIIKEQNTAHKTKELMFNCEFVPAESAAVKLYNRDKLENYWVPQDTNLYASYVFKPNDNEISVLDKIYLHGKDFGAENLDGGNACHISLNEHLSYEQYKYLLTYAGQVGCKYLTFNVPNSECDDCHFITKVPIKVCPKCGGIHISYFDRIIGYLTKTKYWSEGRRIEFGTRARSNRDDVKID